MSVREVLPALLPIVYDPCLVEPPGDDPGSNAYRMRSSRCRILIGPELVRVYIHTRNTRAADRGGCVPCIRCRVRFTATPAQSMQGFPVPHKYKGRISGAGDTFRHGRNRFVIKGVWLWLAGSLRNPQPVSRFGTRFVRLGGESAVD